MAEESNGPDLSNTSLVEKGILPFRLRLPAGTLKSGAPVLVMMHGRGANEGDIYELIPYVDKRVLVAAPRGPLLFSDAPRGSFAWYELSQPGQPESSTVQESLKKIKQFVEELEVNSGVAIDRRQLYIGGFSQGAAMSFALVSSFPEMVAGVIAHSSPFTGSQEKGLKAAGGKLKDKPFFVAHGTEDFLAIDQHGRKAAACLKEVGADLTYKEYPFAHETSLQSRQDIGSWLNSRLKF